MGKLKELQYIYIYIYNLYIPRYDVTPCKSKFISSQDRRLEIEKMINWEKKHPLPFKSIRFFLIQISNQPTSPNQSQSLLLLNKFSIKMRRFSVLISTLCLICCILPAHQSPVVQSDKSSDGYFDLQMEEILIDDAKTVYLCQGFKV